MNDYGCRINRALNYAQQKLPGPVSLDEAAAVAAFSPWHFHRVFIVVVGDSFARFMRKKRLEWAARELLTTQRRILDISLDAGYESQETFARAFKQHFALTPLGFRRCGVGSGDALTGMPSILGIQVGELMKPQIIEREACELVGIVRDYESPVFSDAMTQWQLFCSRSSEIKALDHQCSYGLSLIPLSNRLRYDECDGEFRYFTAHAAHIGCQVPDGMTKVEIPKRKYARYTFQGPVSGFQAFIKNVWTHYLPESGLEVVEAPEIEVYDQRFEMESHDSEMDYLIPVR